MVACPQARDLAAGKQGIPLRSESIPLSAEKPNTKRLGALTYRGGLVLHANHPAFGGLSGLHVRPDGSRFTAITDKGNWVTGTLRYHSDGRLADVADAELGPLGKPADGPAGDARGRDGEALTRLPDGRSLVAFEGDHRILAYPPGPTPAIAGPATRMATPPLLARAKPNGGPEALAALADGRLLMLTESLQTQDARIGFLHDGERWHRVRYPLDADFKPTDAAQVPGGDVLVLERRFDPLGGFQVRLRRIPGDRLAPGAMLDGPVIAHFRRPYVVDNFEGLAVRSNPSGRTLIYIVSDDNFQSLQRTLLLMFALADG